MLLYLTVIQSITQFASHTLSSKTASSVLTVLIVLVFTSVGGYLIHLMQVPYYWQWMEIISPQRWLLPLLAADEYSQETLANTAGQQLCRNKQVSRIHS